MRRLQPSFPFFFILDLATVVNRVQWQHPHYMHMHDCIKHIEMMENKQKHRISRKIYIWMVNMHKLNDASAHFTKMAKFHQDYSQRSSHSFHAFI